MDSVKVLGHVKDLLKDNNVKRSVIIEYIDTTGVLHKRIEE